MLCMHCGGALRRRKAARPQPPGVLRLRLRGWLHRK